MTIADAFQIGMSTIGRYATKNIFNRNMFKLGVVALSGKALGSAVYTGEFLYQNQDTQIREISNLFNAAFTSTNPSELGLQTVYALTGYGVYRAGSKWFVPIIRGVINNFDGALGEATRKHKEKLEDRALDEEQRSLNAQFNAKRAGMRAQRH